MNKSIPAVCSVCQSIATAHLDRRYDYYAETDVVFDKEYDLASDYIMDEHDILDNAGISYGRCSGSQMSAQTIRIKS